MLPLLMYRFKLISSAGKYKQMLFLDMDVVILCF